MRSLRRDWPLAAAALLAAASLMLFWPGISQYDSVTQYKQALTGAYTDWHPPAMARLWALLHAGLGGGAGPMLAVQMLLYWLGLGLIAGALARTGRGRASAAVVLIGCWPPFLGWMAEVLKDAQMTGAATAAIGLVGWWRMRERRVPAAGWAAVAVLLGYALLVRANAAFALAPLTAMLVPARAVARAALGIALALAIIALSGPVNHRLMGAEPTGVEKTQAIFDLAGIAVRDDSADTLFGPAAVRELRTRRCVKPFFWDPLGEQCDDLAEPLQDLTAAQLYRNLAGAALRHPIAYAAHRLAHWNSTERWLVPWGWPGAMPSGKSEPNHDGLGNPGGGAQRFERAAGWWLETPLGWPVVGMALALMAATIAGRRAREPARELALALAVSALALEASFLVLSIASDWRYHLWPMLATVLAVVLLAPVRAGERRAAAVAGTVLLVVVAAGLVTRARLPRPPATYHAMLVG